MPGLEYDNDGYKDKVRHKLVTGVVVTIAVMTVEGVVMMVATYGGVEITASAAAALIAADLYFVSRLNKRMRN